MENENKNLYLDIPKEKLKFANTDRVIHDKELETKPKSTETPISKPAVNEKPVEKKVENKVISTVTKKPVEKPVEDKKVMASMEEKIVCPTCKKVVGTKVGDIYQVLDMRLVSLKGTQCPHCKGEL